ncbi:MAG TPA: ABC transporter permease [Stellaceae bacterium]|nr:ABC transporter permease [Stellaceae bacterium]
MAITSPSREPAVNSFVSDEWLSLAPPSMWQLGLRDLLAGLSLWRLWTRLGWEDIRQRYTRSVLGPFWISLSMLVMVFGLGTLYSKIMHQSLQEYFPFLTLGLLFWRCFADLISDGCLSYLQQEGLIRQIKLPLSTHVFRTIFRQFVVLGHNFVIYLPIAVIFALVPNWNTLLFIPGFLLWIVNAVWMVLLLGMLSARFRDVPPLVASVIQIVFFLSPILWTPATLGTRAGIVEFNPIYHLLELVRAPLVGRQPDAWSWVGGVGIAVIGWGVTFPFFARFRARIAFWL